MNGTPRRREEQQAWQAECSGRSPLSRSRRCVYNFKLSEGRLLLGAHGRIQRPVIAAYSSRSTSILFQCFPNASHDMRGGHPPTTSLASKQTAVCSTAAKPSQILAPAQDRHPRYSWGPVANCSKILKRKSVVRSICRDENRCLDCFWRYLALVCSTRKESQRLGSNQ
jgi:hypothetical protein